MNVYTEIEVDGYERVVYCENNKAKLRSWIAIHNITLGPALGGCRMWKYKTSDEALTDVLRLSKGMTYKNSLAGLDHGGGKSVIWGDAKTEKTPELLAAMGEFVDYMKGKYIVAEDVGITVDDVMVMRQKTKHTAAKTGGNPGPYTAYGVTVGIRAACDYLFDMDEKDHITVAVQGVGSVGYNVIKILSETSSVKFNIIATDMNKEALQKVKEEFGVETIKEEEIYSVDCDVFTPCALGGIINDETIPQLKASIVAGAANNQLLKERHGKELYDKGILYAPDYVINSGGVIMISTWLDRFSLSDDVYGKINIIGDTLTEIFEESDKTGLTTNAIANKIAENRLRLNK